jgi:hypothetical protein
MGSFPFPTVGYPTLAGAAFAALSNAGYAKGRVLWNRFATRLAATDGTIQWGSPNSVYYNGGTSQYFLTWNIVPR